MKTFEVRCSYKDLKLSKESHDWRKIDWESIYKSIVSLLMGSEGSVEVSSIQNGQVAKERFNTVWIKTDVASDTSSLQLDWLLHHKF